MEISPQVESALLFIDDFIAVSNTIAEDSSALSFGTFKEHWKVSPCRFIHLFRYTHRLLPETETSSSKLQLRRGQDEPYITPVYYFLLNRLRDPTLSFRQIVWVIYTLFTLHGTQAFSSEAIFPHAIPFPFHLWPTVLDIVAKLKTLGEMAVEALGILNSMHQHAFHFIFGVVGDEEVGLGTGALPFETVLMQYGEELKPKKLRQEEWILQRRGKLEKVVEEYIKAHESLGGTAETLWENPVEKFLKQFDEIIDRHDSEVVKPLNLEKNLDEEEEQEEGVYDDDNNVEISVLDRTASGAGQGFVDLGLRRMDSSDEEEIAEGPSGIMNKEDWEKKFLQANTIAERMGPSAQKKKQNRRGNTECVDEKASKSRKSVSSEGGKKPRKVKEKSVDNVKKKKRLRKELDSEEVVKKRRRSKSKVPIELNET